MRAALVSLLVVFGGGIAEEAKAQQMFCAVNSQGATNCSFSSINACRDEVRGDGGFCLPQAPIGHRQPRLSDVVRGSIDSANPRQDQRNR